MPMIVMVIIWHFYFPIGMYENVISAGAMQVVHRYHAGSTQVPCR